MKRNDWADKIADRLDATHIVNAYLHKCIAHKLREAKKSGAREERTALAGFVEELRAKKTPSVWLGVLDQYLKKRGKR